MLCRHRGCLFDDIYSLGISLVFEAGQQLAEYPGVEVNDGIGDRERTHSIAGFLRLNCPGTDPH